MDEDPLTERECMMSVVDPKGKGENKFRYVVVTQDELLVTYNIPSSQSCCVFQLTDDGYNRGTDYGQWCRHR